MTTNFIDKNIGSKKSQLLDYYRNRATELIAEIKQTYGDSEYKSRAAAVNLGLIEVKDNLIKTIEQKAKKKLGTRRYTGRCPHDHLYELYRHDGIKK